MRSPRRFLSGYRPNTLDCDEGERNDDKSPIKSPTPQQLACVPTMTPRRRPSLFLFVAFCTIVATTLAQDYSSQFLQAHGELNDPCRSAKECRSFGYVCRNNQTCDCDEMYKADLYKKRCVGGVDQKCVYDEHCIEGAYCMNQEICRCKDSTPFVLDEGMVCARSNIHNTAFVSFFYLILVFVGLVF